jgi:GntR family transcriptional regulator, transcriptional repressor for pyruvate dehydrogenase complex
MEATRGQPAVVVVERLAAAISTHCGGCQCHLGYVIISHMSEVSSIGRARSLADEVIAQVESLILGGTWPVGERLPAEADLAVQLGVSRSVVRDAIRTLAARGLVEVRHGIGTTVAAPIAGTYADAVLFLLARSGYTIGDLFDARATIESGVVVTAAQNRTQEDCAELWRHVEDMETAVMAQNWRATSAADLSFHCAVIRATRLPALITILEPLHHVIASSLFVPDVDNAALFNVPDHRRICEAIVAQDEQAARQAMAAHFASRDDPAFQSLYESPCQDLALIQRVRDSHHGSADSAHS